MSDGLHGKRIVNTRATHQAAEFDDLIRAQGAIPLAYPCIAIQPPDDSGELDAALQRLITGAFDWLVLTSANTVLSIAQRLAAIGLSLGDNPPFRVAVVGSSTGQAVQEQLGLQVDLMPDEYVAEALAEAILSQQSKRVFLPESAIARPTLSDALRAGGADVQVVTAYQTVCGSGGVDLLARLQTQTVDVLSFTSSSTVSCFIQRMQVEGADDNIPALLAGVRVVCIGPKTADTAAEHGLTDVIVPDDYTLDGMLQAITTHFEIVAGEK